MAKPITYYINQSARRYGIDPRAAIAVARGEGGLVNRAGDVGDLAGGGSYGPFQLYTKGALPSQYRGKPGAADQWAWSPQGIDYAIRKMKESGAGGLTGSQAVNAIVRRFERPADPGTSVKNALARYGAGGTGGPASAAPAGSQGGGGGGGLDPRAARMQFAMSLINQIGKPVDANALLGPMMAMRNARTSEPPQVESSVEPFAPGGGPGITYSGQKTTHETAGLPGYPGVDLFAKPGTPFVAPEPGRIVRLSGHPGTTKGQVFGSSLYYQGNSGRTYFVTHLGSTAKKGSYKKGQPIGTVSPWQSGSPHAHVGIHGIGR